MFNFKKIAGVLALTIALSQTMAVVPAYATAAEPGANITCKHANCNNPAESESAPCDTCKNAFFNEDFYEIVNAEQHAFNVTCACEQVFQGTEPHNYDNNGKCIFCGYTKGGDSASGITCKHANCNNPAESESAPCDTCKNAFFNEDFYEFVDDKQHAFNVTCACEQVFQGTEPHNYDSNGKCTFCGYELIVSGGDSTSEATDSAVLEPTYENVVEETNKAIAQAMEEQVREEEAIPVTSFLSTEAVDALPVEVKDEAVTDTVFNVSQITTTRGFVAAVDKIVKANSEGDNVTFYSSKPFTFNADSLAALTNANTEFVYMFSHNGHLYKITIPAGAKIDLDGERFAGPLFIGAKLGTSVLVK